jgi:hypothetical protein
MNDAPKRDKFVGLSLDSQFEYYLSLHLPSTPVVNWFINPINTIDYSYISHKQIVNLPYTAIVYKQTATDGCYTVFDINHSYWSYVHQLIHLDTTESH